VRNIAVLKTKTYEFKIKTNRKEVVMRGLILAIWSLFVVLPLFADEAQYVGVKSCKMCHKSEKIGNQYGIWENSAHSKAFEALSTDEAKKTAEGLNIDDPTKSESCLKCHTTGFGEGGYDLSKSADENAKFAGVQCEACHGAGSNYKSLKTMKGLYAGEIKPEDVGLVMPKEEDCKRCHTPEGNPFYKEFKFEERMEKIAHPIPKE